MCGFLVCLGLFFPLIQIDVLRTVKERERDLFQSAVEPFLLEDFISCIVLNSASTTEKQQFSILQAQKHFLIVYFFSIQQFGYLQKLAGSQVPKNKFLSYQTRWESS